MNCNCAVYKFPHRPGSGGCKVPKCSDCEFGRVEKDPFGTGDKRYTEIHCLALKCPWGKE
jgi:hypothetical protein